MSKNTSKIIILVITLLMIGGMAVLPFMHHHKTIVEPQSCVFLIIKQNLTAIDLGAINMFSVLALPPAGFLAPQEARTISVHSEIIFINRAPPLV